jgi:succinyl-CoA synthetase beta subunit
MKFIVMPTTDAKIVFTEEELSHMKKNVDETEVIVHENILVEKRNAMGLVTLPSEETGQIEWTYPVYEYNSEELNNLLNNKNWNNDEY